KVKKGVVYLAFDPEISWGKMEPILGMRVLPNKVRTSLFRGDEGNQASKKPVKKFVKLVNKKPDSQSGKGKPKRNKAKKDVFTVNLYYDRRFTSEILKRLVPNGFEKVYYYKTGAKLTSIREIKSDQDIMDLLKTRIKSESDSSDDDYHYSDDDLEEIKNVDFHTEGDDSVVIKNIATQDPFLTKLCSVKVLFKGNIKYGVNEETPQVDPDDNQIDYVYKVKKGVVYLAFDPEISWGKMEPILGMRIIIEGRCAGNKGNKHRVLPNKVRTSLFRMDEGNQASKKPVKKHVKKPVKLVNKKPDSQSRKGTSQAFFEMDRRCAAFENGILKSFNRAILGPMMKPIIIMLEETRLYIMQRLVAMNKLAFSLEDTITPSITSKNLGFGHTWAK
nr:F-box domain, leucine-rich repeat domain, L domain-like protein [Tanacetum cinerariifolium]